MAKRFLIEGMPIAAKDKQNRGKERGDKGFLPTKNASLN